MKRIFDIKDQLDKEYNDNVVYKTREEAIKQAEKYIIEVEQMQADVLGKPVLYKRDVRITDLPGLSYVRVWSKNGSPQLFNKNFVYQHDEVYYMASAELNEWFERELKQRRECGIL